MLPSPIKLFRLFLLSLFSFWTIASFWPIEKVAEDKPPLIFASAFPDHLGKIFYKEIKQAKTHIDLYIYSLTDPNVVKVLNQAAQKGLQVQVIYDTKTDPRAFRQLDPNITQHPIRSSALMHRKILVIDQQKVWIGSANFTSESLRMHENLIVGLYNPTLAKMLHKQHFDHFQGSIAEQKLLFWPLPEKKQEALSKLLELIASAQTKIEVCMFTFTHKELAQKLIEAHMRGVQVSVTIDKQSSFGASKQVAEKLKLAGIDVRINQGSHIFHHKFMLVDNTTLVLGSANWTKAAFSKNYDCILLLDPLTKKQQKKMKKLSHIHQCTTRMRK